jgi:hypothetical protein
MARASLALNKNLDSPAALAALRAMGLSFDELRQMEPGKRFIEIGKAVQGIHDPIDQANAKTALFGRTFDAVSAAFDQDVDAIIKNTTALTDAQLRGLDLIGDMWDALTNRVSKGTKSWVADIGLRLLVYKELYDFVRGSPIALPEPKAPVNVRNARKEWQEFTVDLEEAGRIGKEMNEKIEAATKLRQKAEHEAATAFKKSAQEVTESLERMRYGHVQLGQAAVAASQNVQGFTIRTGEFVAVGNDYSKTLMAAQIKTDAFGHVITTNVMPSLGNMGTAAAQTAFRVANAIGSMSPPLKSFKEVARDALGGVEQLLGGIQTAWAQTAVVSARIIDTITAKMGTYAEKAVAAGSAAATAIGGAAGGKTGSAVAGIAVALGGAALKASAFGAAMSGAGVAGSVALGAATMGIGLAAVGVVKLVMKWREHKKMVEDNTKSITDFQQSIWTTLNAEQVAEAGGREWAATVIGVRDAYMATGRTAEQALTDVKAMWDSTTQSTEATKAAMDRINQAFIEQKQRVEELRVTTDTLDAIAKKYNITIEEMGPAWQRQELDKKAQELYKDYQILVSAGVDHVLVLQKMAGGVNEYVRNAIKMGVEVPEAMRPMLEAMVQQGLLTDAAGTKITDLGASGVTFAMTMSEGFKSLITEVQNLADMIARSLGLSLDVARKKADVATGAMEDGFNRAADAARDLNDEIDATSYGHSPGGLSDIIAMAPLAGTALGAMALRGRSAVGELTSDIADVGRVIGRIGGPENLPPGAEGVTIGDPGNLPRGIGETTRPRPRSGGGSGQGSGGGDHTTIIELDGDPIARYVERYLDQKSRRKSRLRAA